MTTIRLTELTACGGCAAKWGPSSLESLVTGLGHDRHADLLVGLRPSDDAAVHRVASGVAMVSTIDFFPPVVDDPEDFGVIAAANACSDVFAMGGRVVLALNVAAFPDEFPADVAATILAAGAETVRAAGGVLAGGHTIRNPEPLYGLAVQGLVDPDHIWTKGGARPGDVLVLSKALGTGLVLAASDPATVAETTRSMRTLNRGAAEALAGLGPHAVTDVTGFGLAGHAWEMAERSGAVFRIDAGALPLLAGAAAAARGGVRTGGDARNRSHLEGRLTFTGPVDPVVDAVVHDPQTSGGLLAAIDPVQVAAAVDAGFTAIGEVHAGPAAVRVT